MSIFRRTEVDLTTAQEAAVIAGEATDTLPRSDPEQLRADAAQLVAVATTDAERVRDERVRDAQARADALLAEASQLEADQAESERVGAYLAAVETGRANFARALCQEADLAAMVERNATHCDEVATRHAAATARAGEAQRAWDAAKQRGADLDELAELRIALAASTSLPDAVAEQLAVADDGHRRALDTHGRATDGVRVAWSHLEQLAATDGLERPPCVPGPADKLAARLRELERDQRLRALAARSPEFQRRMAEKAMRRERQRRVLPPELARITDARNAAATFLGTQHR